MKKRKNKRMLLKIFCGVLMAMLLLINSGRASEKDLWTPSRIKMIELSWSNPTVDFLVKNVREIEKSCPMDGVTVRFNGDNAGKKIVGSNAMSKNPWKYEWFKKELDLYKSIKFEKLTDNFYYTVVSPGDADWFNDEDWASVCNNYGIAARIVKETGMRGICFDIEEYGKKFWSFSTIKTGQSYEEAYKIARKRGQEWGKAVFGACPDIAVLALHMMSYGSKTTSLTVPFFNGVMSVMPPEATLNDGLEGESYHAKKAADYDQMIISLSRKYLGRVEKSNINIYKTQVKLAPGYYMDGMFPSKKDSYWHRILQPEISADPKGFLRRNLMSGTRVADEFIWIYGEKGAWWKGTAFKTWEELVPGVTNAVLSVKDPDALASSNLPNLLKNSEFKEKQKNWNFWQIEQEMKDVPLPGKGYEEGGILKMECVTNGCFVQSVAVEPGGTYFLRVTARYESKTSGFCSGCVAFQDKNRKWNNSSSKQNIVFPHDSIGGWITKTVCFTVPDDSYFASVQMGASNLGKEGKVAFKKIEFYKF